MGAVPTAAVHALRFYPSLDHSELLMTLINSQALVPEVCLGTLCTLCASQAGSELL